MPATTTALRHRVRIRVYSKPAAPEVRPAPPAGYLRLKAVLDAALAAVLLVAAIPAVAVAALLVRLTSRGPAFYSQVRVGRGGRPFTLYKLRTMYHDCERLTGPRWATPDDPRVTPVGWVLRKAHVDELPQLWNVLRGEMSLVGPRPERPEFVSRLEEVIPHYRERLLVRPGITGLAQIQLPPDTDLDSVRRKLAYDRYYVHHVGFGLDARIVLGTALHLLSLPFALSRRLVRLPDGGSLEAAVGHVTAASLSRLQPA